MSDIICCIRVIVINRLHIMKYQIKRFGKHLKEIDKMMDYLMSRLEELEIKQREIGLTAAEGREYTDISNQIEMELWEMRVIDYPESW